MAGTGGGEDRAVPQSQGPCSRFRVSLLGPFALERDGIPIYTSKWQRRVEVLFKLLIIAPEKRRLRDQIIDVLWPESPPDLATANLRMVVHRLRLALGGDSSTVLSERGWVALNPEYQWEVDLEEADRIVRSDDSLPALEAAAALFRGDPLPENMYEDWAMPVREHAGKIWRTICSRLADLHRGRSDYDDAVFWLERALVSDPTDEELLRSLLSVLNEANRGPEALRRFRQFEQRLARELDVAPSASTRALVEQIKLSSAIGIVSAPSEAAPQSPLSSEGSTINHRTRPQPHQADEPLLPVLGPRRPNRPAMRAMVATGAVLVAALIAWLEVTRGFSLPGGASQAGSSNPHPRGSGAGQFIGPSAVTLDRQGHVWVTDLGNNRVQEFSSDGRFMNQVGTLGKAPGQLDAPSSIAVDSQSNLYVADGGNARIQKFSSSLKPLPIPGFLTYARALTLDGRGHLFASDLVHSQILEFTLAGAYVRSIALHTGHIRFDFPAGLTADGAGHLWIADRAKNVVWEISLASHAPKRAIGRGFLRDPSGLAVDRRHRLYVADSGHNRILEFSDDGRLLHRPWGASGSLPGQFSAPSGVAVDAAGNVYAADFYNDRVQKFSPNGKLLWVTNGRDPLVPGTRHS